MDREHRSILFVDICDSTRILEAHGDEKGRAVLVACLSELQRTTEGCQGTVLNEIGDELMVAFDDALTATRAACALQVAVEDAVMRGTLPPGLHVRIGFHHGPVVVHAAEVFGKTIHLARRVASASKAQQIVTSRQTLDLLPEDAGFSSRFLERTHLKGHDDVLEMHEILWDEKRGTVVELDSVTSVMPPPSVRRLTLTHEGHSFELDAARPVVTVGRDPHCNLVIEHPKVSRLHGRFEYRRNGFAFVDASANGSHVCLENAHESFVRRDEEPLTSDGVVKLGGNDAESPVVRFTVLADGP